MSRRTGRTMGSKSRGGSRSCVASPHHTDSARRALQAMHVQARMLLRKGALTEYDGSFALGLALGTRRAATWRADASLNWTDMHSPFADDAREVVFSSKSYKPSGSGASCGGRCMNAANVGQHLRASGSAAAGTVSALLTSSRYLPSPDFAVLKDGYWSKTSRSGTVWAR